MGDALALQTEDLARRGSPGNLQLLRSRQGRRLHASPQGGLDEGDGDATVDIVSISLEDLMGFHLDEDIEIAVRAAVFAFLPFAPQPETRSRLHAGRDLELDRFRDPDLSPAGAFLAGGRDDASLSPALRAGRADAEKTAGLHHLAPSVAAAANLRRGSRGATRSPAGGAEGVFLQFDFGARSQSRIHERDPEVVAQIGPGPGGRA